jgi:hypothetical protein
MATHMTLFEVVYEKNPPLVLPYMSGISNVQEVDCNLTTRMTILYTLKENLVMDQNHMNQQEDQGCSENQFAKGDQLFLCLQLDKKTSLKYKQC